MRRFALLPLLLPALLFAGSARAQAPEPEVPVAARALERGQTLTAEDVRFPDGSAADAGTAPIGWVTRRVMKEGEPLTEPSIAPPDLVKQGSAVQLLWSAGALEIRLVGRALNSAAVGERVTVRVDVHRRFEGVAVGRGLVKMDLSQRNSR
ncbi:MAG TPA: flagellar basal body P-ring formation chaperone FlgA [Longimicrobiaceae bacterium]|nr:flagellar basal body P-ring formation chaperone FlgA [Longimicrobiaceae bacterium]